MASVHFYLKNALSKEAVDGLKQNDKAGYQNYCQRELQILCTVSIKGTRQKALTGKHIRAVYWDFKQERANTKLYRILGTQLNSHLNDIHKVVSKLADERENQGQPITYEELKELVKPNSSLKTSALSFEDRFGFFLEHHKTENGYGLRDNTRKKYIGFKNYLVKFAANKKCSLSLELFNRDFLQSFKDYLVADQKLSDNTVSKYVKAGKTFIKFYMNRGLIKHFNIAEVKVAEREGEVYVVGLEEMVRLHKLKIEDRRLANARDVFMFMCWTGQRFSDIAALKRTDILKDEFGDDFWHLTTQKTRDTIKVPLIDYAKEILDRHKNANPLLPIVTNQKTNEALKDLAKEAELSNSVKIIKFHDGIKSEETVPFHEIISTHIGRKSFITASLILGVPERVVREISGHKDEKSFRRYVNLADSYKTRVIKEAFSKNSINKRLHELKV